MSNAYKNSFCVSKFSKSRHCLILRFLFFVAATIKQHGASQQSQRYTVYSGALKICHIQKRWWPERELNYIKNILRHPIYNQLYQILTCFHLCMSRFKIKNDFNEFPETFLLFFLPYLCYCIQYISPNFMNQDVKCLKFIFTTFEIFLVWI